MELAGQRLGHYHIHEELSRGGMGVVYRATDTRLNRDVALKVLPEELTHDADRRRRFLKEAQAASALEHPHIAVIYEADEVDGRAYIAMELIRGDKLSDVLKRGRLPVARVLDIGAEVAAGLARAHDKGVVHRDLKPANVMINDEGRAKIIDFGIAKLIEIAAQDGGATKTSHDTAAGVVLGTMTYMSPEQARGEDVDHRSDIFAFGILLHEMLAGEPPFRGKSGIETASAILHHPAPRLPALGPAVAGEATADIQRIVDKCLEKDLADRYQGMKDLAVDLRAARRRLDTGTHPAATGAVAPPRPRLLRWAVLGTAAAAILAAVIFLRQDRAEITDTGVGDATRPSVAVLYFDNASGDKELDWMRTGITEMVVTDLSQSSDIEVVGTDRLYGILAELRREDDRVLTPEIINAVAQRTGVDRVVVGSYMKSGDAIRINVRLQDAKTGRIEASERVEGPNASALFSMIDDLSRRIRSKFEGLRADAKLLVAPGVVEEGGLDRGLGDVTTSSIEAYRLYAEGINLHERYREKEAAALFEKAIAEDPAFAVAYAKLAVVQSNMGRLDLRDKYATQALKLSDRLTPRERFYIEGYYYSTRPSTVGRAIDAYSKCVSVDPGHQGCRHNLALIYQNLERFAEAADHYQHLVRRGGTYAITYQNLAMVQLGSGDGERGLETLNAFLKRNPESAAAQAAHGAILLALNRPEEAVRSFAQATLLNNSEPNALLGRAIAQGMREDWNAVAEVGSTLWKSDDQTARWFGSIINFNSSLLRGRGAEALQWAERTAAAYTNPGPRTANGHINATTVLLAQRRAELAVKTAAQALTYAKGLANEPAALLWQATALSAAGRESEAAAAVATLTSLVDPLAANRDGRAVNLARGMVALSRGDAAAAVKPLEDAAAALTPRMPNPLGGSQHVLIWSALGQAYFDSGQLAQALPWFEKAATAGVERTSQPLLFVRSFYYLGRIYEQQGNSAKAREHYRRFVNYWKDGDLDRDRVAEAQRKISS